MAKELGNLKRGLAFVISAPAGTGKTTLVEKLTQNHSEIVESISYTTRQPRANEAEGEHYHFISQEKFEEMNQKGLFLEQAQVFGNYYGTSKETLDNLLNLGKHVILVIDTQGALQLKENTQAIFIFLSPPSMEVLQKRLESRQTDSLDVIQERLSWATKEMELAKYYDYHIINEDVEVTYNILKSIIIAEEHKICNQG